MNPVWRKLGRLYDPQARQRHPKLATHAANPLPVALGGDMYRVFFSGRDARNRSSVGAVDIDVARLRVVEEHHAPVFLHGPAGSFHADGVSLGNCYTAAGRRYILFMGWQVHGQAHWRGDIGRLVLGQDLSLHLDGDGPFLGSDAMDPVSLSYPWVQPVAGGFRLWYGSTVTWDAGNGEMLHVIKAASSADGDTWHKEGQSIPAVVGVAQAFSRPTVAVGRSGGYEMWFSFRSGGGEPYRIGKAVSEDGRNWRLELAQAGITVSPDGWDSEMIAYPLVFDHEGQRFMLYNGNGYGKSGFGLAVLED